MSYYIHKKINKHFKITSKKDHSMTIEEIQEELEISGVEMEHVSKLIRICKRFGFDPKEMDERLLKWGYPKVFTIYDED